MLFFSIWVKTCNLILFTFKRLALHPHKVWYKKFIFKNTLTQNARIKMLQKYKYIYFDNKNQQ